MKRFCRNVQDSPDMEQETFWNTLGWTVSGLARVFHVPQIRHGGVCARRVHSASCLCLQLSILCYIFFLLKTINDFVHKDTYYYNWLKVNKSSINVKNTNHMAWQLRDFVMDRTLFIKWNGQLFQN